jgi:hypothetical protein
MLKLEGLRWAGVALVAALLAMPEAAAADGRAASSRSDGNVSSRGDGGGGTAVHRDAPSNHSSSGSDSGRTAVSRGSDDHGSRGSGGGSPVAAGRRDSDPGGSGPRVAVPRDDAGGDHPDRTRGRRRPGDHDGGDRTIVIGGWWGDPWYGYGPYWGVWSSWWWPYGPYRGYGYRYYDDRYDRDYDEGYGALDLDVWPEEVEVYVDGERVGIADDFDGCPSFLWLPHGTYDVVFYHPGFRTLARQYSIYRGVIVDVEDRMERGEAVRPEDLPATSTINRDARMRRNEERAEAARAREEWRERRDRAADVTVEQVEDEDMAEAGAAERVARLHLRVTPADASVYLDGNFLGTGREMEQLSAGLVLTPGSHRLQVVRPGYESEDVSFDSDPGEALELRVDLEEE